MSGFGLSRATILSTGTAAIALGAAAASFFLVGSIRAKAASTNSPRYLSYRANGDANDFTTNSSGIPMLENSSDGNKLAWHRLSVSYQAAWTHSPATLYRLGIVFDGTNGTSYANNVQQGQAAMTSTFGATGQLVRIERAMKRSPGRRSMWQRLLLQSARPPRQNDCSSTRISKTSGGCHEDLEAALGLKQTRTQMKSAELHARRIEKSSR